jgi:hypothetical protein
MLVWQAKTATVAANTCASGLDTAALPCPAAACLILCLLTLVVVSLLTVLQAQVRHAMQVHDALDAALAELDELKGISRPTPSGGRSRFSGAPKINKD